MSTNSFFETYVGLFLFCITSSMRAFFLSSRRRRRRLHDNQVYILKVFYILKSSVAYLIVFFDPFSTYKVCYILPLLFFKKKRCPMSL